MSANRYSSDEANAANPRARGGKKRSKPGSKGIRASKARPMSGSAAAVIRIASITEGELPTASE